MNWTADSAGGNVPRPVIRVVCGPTAAGKSVLGMELAVRHGAAIISADSRAIYRRFDIGTAKPSAEERARVPHYGIDIVEPEARYSAAAWAEDAAGWIAAAAAAGVPPLVVGGTGFYLRALFDPIFDAPAVDPRRRNALEAVLGQWDDGELRRWCRVFDPARAHLGRTQLARAIETALLCGARLSELHRTRARAAAFTARYLVVDPGPALAARITTRVDEMFAAGWLDEVRALAASVPDGAPAWLATGYRVVRAVARKELPHEQGRERIIAETRQYAKRQRTWFRHQLPAAAVTRLDPLAGGAAAAAEDWWRAVEGA